MIRIQKSKSIPAILNGAKSRGAKATEQLCNAADSGVVDHRFLKTIYAHKQVKQVAIEDQFGKCLFCESKITATQHGDVEHFRPKGGVQQSRDERLITPGYYWLAYEWSNLTFCCQICNQTHKKNLFPLLNPKSRATHHDHDLNREKPMLVNPINEDPGLSIGFRDEVAYGKDENGRGSATIETVGLNRPNLCEMRRELLSKYRDAWSVLLKAEKLAQQSSVLVPPELIFQRKKLEQWGTAPHEFSQMIQTAGIEIGASLPAGSTTK
ncbi:MAG: hypothetical protein WCH39_13555 [Schlesneria sp.]|jgi:hypothetical protein